MAKRKRERVPKGLLPADPDAPLNPVALRTLYRTAPPTQAQARAIAAEAKKRACRAVIARDKQFSAVDRAIAQGDWGQVGEWFAAEQERVVRPAVKQHEYVKQRLLSLAGNQLKQRKAAIRAKPYVRQAIALHRKHPEWSRNAIVAYILRALSHPKKKPSARQILRYLDITGIE
jgi:hypothetical protein